MLTLAGCMLAAACSKENNGLLELSAEGYGSAAKTSVSGLTVQWEGSGLANCVSDVKKAFPKATVIKGFSIYGHEVRSGKAKVEKWLKGL